MVRSARTDWKPQLFDKLMTAPDAYPQSTKFINSMKT